MFYLYREYLQENEIITSKDSLALPTRSDKSA